MSIIRQEIRGSKKSSKPIWYMGSHLEQKQIKFCDLIYQEISFAPKFRNYRYSWNNFTINFGFFPQ